MTLTEQELNEMSKHYREIRKQVYEESTKPVLNSNNEHNQNKLKLKNKITEICQLADLNLYSGSDNIAALKIWSHLWEKNRYAGIRASIASKEIADIRKIFNNYEIFSDSAWDFVNKNNLGAKASSFFNRVDDFEGLQTIGNEHKLKNLIYVARELKQFIDQKQPDEPVINFIIGQNKIEEVWNIQQRLIAINYRADLTTLHFMMDLGFPVIKPDIVISSLFLDWGWLNKIINNLPTDLTIDDLRGKGKYKSKYVYTNPKMYKPIIELARKIVSITKKEDLENDIGWVTNNSLREFDLFLVKYGQDPESHFGIVKKLFKSNKTIKSYCSTVN